MMEEQLKENNILFNELYEKTKDCGRVQFINLLMAKEIENRNLNELFNAAKQVAEGHLKNEIELKKQLEKIKNEPLTNRIGRIDSVIANIYSRNRTHQKEFIEWLEQNIENEEYCYLAQNPGERCRKDVFEEALSKYKEIIGGKHE